MQRNNLAEIARTEHVPMSAVMGSDVGLVRAIQTTRGDDPCFMTEKRLLCKVEACEWRKDCRRLMAVWKR